MGGKNERRIQKVEPAVSDKKPNVVIDGTFNGRLGLRCEG